MGADGQRRAAVSKEQETDATIHTGSLKSDNRRLEGGFLAG